MPAKIQLPPAKSFEEIWAIIQETNEMMKANSAEADRRFKENAEMIKTNAAEARKNAAEADKWLKEVKKELKEAGELIKENGRQMGFVHNKLGELVEHIVMPNINKKFRAFKYNFGTPERNVKFFDKKFRKIAEADILMADDSQNLMIGEVKTTLRKEDVDRHVKRLETIRNEAYSPIDGSRRLLGFMAGAIVSDDVKEYAYQNGFFVAAQSGDTLKLDVPEGFNPRIW
jgi:ElaB/YqjD/DUF883 family membrane-anchored ribosome-binding protein